MLLLKSGYKKTATSILSYTPSLLPACSHEGSCHVSRTVERPVWWGIDRALEPTARENWSSLCNATKQVNSVNNCTSNLGIRSSPQLSLEMRPQPWKYNPWTVAMWELWTDVPHWAATRFVTHTYCEVINVCCFKPLSCVVICCTKIDI